MESGSTVPTSAAPAVFVMVMVPAFAFALNPGCTMAVGGVEFVVTLSDVTAGAIRGVDGDRVIAMVVLMSGKPQRSSNVRIDATLHVSVHRLYVKVLNAGLV